MVSSLGRVIEINRLWTSLLWTCVSGFGLCLWTSLWNKWTLLWTCVMVSTVGLVIRILGCVRLGRLRVASSSCPHR